LGSSPHGPAAPRPYKRALFAPNTVSNSEYWRLIGRKKAKVTIREIEMYLSGRVIRIYEEDILIPLVIRYQYVIMRFIEISCMPPAISLDLYVIHVQMPCFILNRVAEVLLYFVKYPL